MSAYVFLNYFFVNKSLFAATKWIFNILDIFLCEHQLEVRYFGLKSLLRQGLLEPDFYGDLVYKLKKIVGSNNFSAQFIKINSHYKKIGYNINVLQ